MYSVYCLTVVPDPLNFPPVTGPDFIVSLSPMMIRTFNVTIEPKINNNDIVSTSTML